MEDKIYGRNPVIEALSSNRDIDKIFSGRANSQPYFKNNGYGEGKVLFL